ncbi:ThiF family adenylyltransferase [Bacillus sp. MMSF_3353]|uniref:HesA/MoeB/ThiF family protein n=1 Tax=Bacillus sp. MMSF_3353 TaxID=3047081 RepID=UPI00273E4C92|nr:ThiF family adenylyltransferase [Bacillus sp. MMSF_3353]
MFYPKLKDIYKPISYIEGIIRVGLDGSYWEIPDEEGIIFDILNKLDGSFSIDKISNDLDIDFESLKELINMLDNNGLIESDSSNNHSLDTLELERYRANINYFSNFSSISKSKYEYQDKLKNASVAVLGLGGANVLLAELAGMGVGKIVGVDYDSIELSNLNRQFLYTEHDIGKLKVDVIKNKIEEINSNVDMKVFNKKINSAYSLFEVIKDVDLVVNGIDQPPILATRWVNAVCNYFGIPFIQGGIGNLKIMWQLINPTYNGCYDCFLINSIRNEPIIEHQIRLAYKTKFDGRNTSFSPHVALLGGILGSEIARYFTGYAKHTDFSTSMALDTRTLEIKKSGSWSKIEDCPTCSKKSNQNELEPIDIEELIKIAKGESYVDENITSVKS